MKAYIGIDVSKATLDVCYLKDSALNSFERDVFENNEKGYKALLIWAKSATKQAFVNIHVTLEATGVYHLGVAHALNDKNSHVSVINPLQAHHYAKGMGMRAKTDRLDSIMLAHYCWERHPETWKPAPKALIELKALNLRLHAVEKDKRREQNRLESAETARHSKSVIRLIKKSVRRLEEEEETLIKLINRCIDEQDDLKKNRELLLSIKGIGDVCSRFLVAEIYEGRFDSASQCAAYMGLIPVPQQSGNREVVHLSKAGNRKMKSKLYMAAISAKQHNPILKEHYERLIARGKSKMSALCAVMRRLVQMSYGVIKHQKVFCLQANQR